MLLLLENVLSHNVWEFCFSPNVGRAEKHV